MSFSKKSKPGHHAAGKVAEPSQPPTGPEHEPDRKAHPTEPAVAETPSSETSPGVAPEPSEQDTERQAGTAIPEPSDGDLWKDRHLRLQADFDNYRKRMARERQETVALANADLLSDLLTPLDHMDRALDTMQRSAGDADPCVQGVRMVQSELLGALDRFGLKRMGVIGEPFDPARHEALGMIPATETPDGHVVAEVRAGYLLNGRILRAAQVLVASSPPSPEDTGDAPVDSPAQTE